MTHKELQALVNQALEASIKGNYDEAEILVTEVLAELVKLTDSEDWDNSPGWSLSEIEILRGNAFLSLGDIALRRGNYDAALEQGQKALTLTQKYALKELQPKVWKFFGSVYHYRGSWHKALEYYNAALDMNQELSSKVLVASLMANVGTVNWELGIYEKALEYLNKAIDIYEELGDNAAVARVTGNIGNVYSSRGNYYKALEYLNNALTAHEKLGVKAEAARIMGNIGGSYANLGSFDTALNYYYKAHVVQQELGSERETALIMGNIGAIYANLGNYNTALEYMNKALATYQKLEIKAKVSFIIGNIGNVYDSLGIYDTSLEYYNKALAMHEELGENKSIARVMGNIGNVYGNLGIYNKALEYFNKALAMHEELGEKSSLARVMGNIGSLYANSSFDGYKPEKAEEMLLKALALSDEIGMKYNIYYAHKSLADLYEVEKRDSEALVQFKKFYEIEKEVQSEEAKKQANLMEQRRQAAEREKQIAIAKAAADAKHQATEQLLHNVLPPSIANKMLDGVKLIAEKIPSVSVLFADIVNFTKLSQRITPEELVEGLDRIFSTFDALAEKHGLEKIKTIGDAYMVVSGAPVQRENHAEAMAHFALEMVEAMKEFRSISTGEVIQLRIGIHSGEVVAGVIGKNKFAYDLWGDAVNTASRMESHGEAGKIHISEEFMHALKTAIGGGTGRDMSLQPDSPLSSFQSLKSFYFQERGELDIKGKGRMRTYFMEKVAAEQN